MEFDPSKIDVATGMVWFLAFLFSTTVHEAMSFVTTLLSILVVMNVFLCVFNLLPLPPLDRSAVLSGLLPERHALKLQEFESNAMMSMVGLVIAWRVFPYFTGPLFSALLRLVHPFDSYS